MKKNLLLLVACFIAISLNAQKIFDYESAESTLTFQFFGSGLEGVVLDPVDNPDPTGNNTSATVYPFPEPAGALVFAGAFTNPNPEGGVNATNGGQICIDAYFEEEKTMTVKLEGDNSDLNWELTMVPQEINSWTQLCFDLDAPSEVGGHAATGNMYNTLVIFYELGEGATEDQNLFIDNISLPEGGTTGGEETTVILDWEADATTTSFFFFGSSLEGAVMGSTENPNKSGINMTDSVLQITKPAMALTFAGAFSEPNPSTLTDATNGGQICVDVLYDHIGNISIKLEQEINGGPVWRAEAANTKVNEWETICFDFSSVSLDEPFNAATGLAYQRVVFFTDFGSEGGDTDVVSYVDNLRTITSTESQDSEVTFALDMNGYGEAFTNTSVFGEFNDWSIDGIQLTDDDGDNIWTTTLTLPLGSYEYLFAVDNTIPETLPRTSTCTTTFDDGNGAVFTNRLINVVADETLDAVCFGSCYACGASTDITWNLAVANPAESGVWLAGGADFGAPGGNYQMSDDDGDGVYSITIERLTGFEGYYTFTNGNCPDFSCKENIAGQECARPENFNDRYLDSGVTEVNTCFAECTTDLMCSGSPEPTMTTFTVDMNMETVNDEGVRIAGQFSNWSDIDMTDEDGDGIYTVTLELNKLSYEYLFKNGPEGWETFAGGEDCTVTTPDGMFTNRVIDLTEAGDTSASDEYCFESCVACSVGTNDLPINNSLINVYPTIANDAIYVDILSPITSGTVQIYSLNGMLLHTSQISSSTSSNRLEISEYTQGTYIITLTTDTFISTKRFIKM